MAGGSQKCSANHPSPKCVRPPEVRSEIEHLQLAHTLSRCMNRIPTSGNQMQDREHSNNCSRHINDSLHNIGPNYRRQPTFKRINKSEDSNDSDRRNLASTQCNSHNNGNSINSDTFRSSTSQQE